MGRQDFYDDPDAPTANSLVPAASAVVVDDQGRIVLQRRRDNDNWALPGGVMEIGESIADCARREVREETGRCRAPVSRRSRQQRLHLWRRRWRRASGRR